MEENLSMIEVVWNTLKNIELWAVITGIVYIILAVRENIWCWIFGIVSSALSIYLFYTGKLYAESILYTYYVFAGCYGWYAWTRTAKETGQGMALELHEWPWKTHWITILVGSVLALGLGFILRSYTDADSPIIDAFTTVFSFIATYMVTRKVVETWLYWIIIDLVTIGLYTYKAYYLYAILMVVYTILAGLGYVKWKRQVSKKALA